MKSWKRNSVIAVCTILAVLIATFVWMYVETDHAVRDWNRLGGAVTVQYSRHGLGPDQMSFGSMPGVRTSENLDAIRAAAVRLNSVPGCRKLHLHQPNWSCEQLMALLPKLKLEYLGLQAMSIDQTCMESLARLHIDSIGVGGGRITVESIRHFLNSSPERSMRVTGPVLTVEQRVMLSQEFGNQISFE